MKIPRTPAKQRLFDIATINQKLIKEGKLTIQNKLKSRNDAYGDDSPMLMDISRVRSLVLHWITQDATDTEYPYKLTDDDLNHLIRDLIGIAPRLLSNHIPPKPSIKFVKKHIAKIEKLRPQKRLDSQKRNI